jgi:hypothetical protein
MSRPTVILFALLAALGTSAGAAARSSAPAKAPRSGQLEQAPGPGRHQPIRPGDRNCLQHAGSLIPARKGECLPVNGRSYSGGELRATGANSTARALQMLDPSIGLGH